MLSESYLQSMDVSRVYTQVPACIRSNTPTLINVMNLLKQVCDYPIGKNAFPYPTRQEAQNMNDLQFVLHLGSMISKTNSDDVRRVFDPDSKALVNLFLSDLEHFTEDGGLQKLEIDCRPSFGDHFYYVTGEDGAAVNFVVAWIQQVMAVDEQVCKSFFGGSAQTANYIRIIHQQAPNSPDYELVSTLAQTAWSHSVVWELFEVPFKSPSKEDLAVLKSLPAEVRSAVLYVMLNARFDIALSWHEEGSGFGWVSSKNGKWSFHAKEENS
jgi:hypothetical protein